MNAFGRCARRRGPIPLRRTAPGFAALAEIVVGQQISRAAADAILKRLHLAVPDLHPAAILSAGEDALRSAGLSRPKQRTLLALASHAVEDALRLDDLPGMNADEAIATLCALPGVGPWTAEVYLLVAAGHPDVFPAGDVALQAAAANAFGLDGRPSRPELSARAESWRPWRSAAARLLWAHYTAMRGREAAPAVRPPILR